MFKKIFTLLAVLFSFAAFAAHASTIPSTSSNNTWTGNNSFLYHSFVLNQGNSCGTGQAMVGYQTDFTPICAAFSGGGVQLLNGLTGTVVIANGDSNLSVSVSGQNIVLRCPGCSGGGSGTPGGTAGAIQYNNSGSFGGVVATGLLKMNGASAPTAAVPDTDFALPFVLNCTTGITCPKVGENYTFSLTGSAGTGSVATADFGQVGGYAAAGTTISGLPSIYSLNPAWSLAQINALMSRFNAVNITACSVNSNVATLTGANSYSAGQTIVLQGLSTCAGLNNTFASVSATGLSQTQFEVALSTTNVSGSEAGYSYVPNGTGTPNQSVGLIVIPPGLPDNNPATAFNNTWGKVWDARKGYGLQQASQYGVQCGIQTFNATLTTGQNTVVVGSSLNTNNVGQTAIFTSTSGYGNTGTQSDWEPTITAFNLSTLTATLSGNAPFGGAVSMTVGTNNQVALQRAINDSNGIIPIWLPQCSMLTDTLRWNGTSFIGQQMNYTNVQGFPAHDTLQQQDNIPITAWSINTGTGVTTFTIPAYAAHSILPASLYPTGFGQPTGDKVTLAQFPTSTFFNNQTVTIATQPTPTTFTVNSVFGQSTSSATEAGVAGATTAANINALRVEHTTFQVDNQIDGSFAWNHYSPAGTLTVEPPYYRPMLEMGEPMNNPLAPGWGLSGVNGVANITQNLAVICVPTTLASLPAIGTTIVFPYQTGGLVSRTVSSTAGSCSTGYAPYTLSAALPNTSGYTATQAEWFTYTTPQTLSVSMPGTITLPYTITVTLPLTPIPGHESNVSTHGHLIIGTQEWDYMGITFGGSAGGTATLTLRNGPTTVNAGSGWSGGSVVFPLNPCQAMYHNPWPVQPTINGALPTPVGATYYAGICGANAAISFPAVDGRYTAFSSSGLTLAHFINVTGTNTSENALGSANNNGSMFIYEAGDYTGYGNTFDSIQGNGLWGGFMQGPASVNQYGVSAVGPTSTGQTINNCTFRTGYSIVLTNMQQSKINRCDTYSTETSPYDGTIVGASTDLYIGYSANEKTGGLVTNVAQFTVQDYNGEPENGNHFEFPPSVESDGTNVTWLGNIFEGGFNIFGGGFQQFHGTQMAGPVFNYGGNNYFEKLYGLNAAYNDSNVYDGSLAFYNWGSFTSCQSVTGVAGPMKVMSPGCIQTYDGHDAFATMFGNLINPNENILGGIVGPDEFNFAGLPVVFDQTELWWGKHTECSLNTGNQCILQQFGGFGGPILIGPHERITDAPAILKMNVMAKNSGNLTFNVVLSAQNTLSNATCTPNFSLTNFTVTALSSGWTPVLIPVNFSGTKGCALSVQFSSATSVNTLEVGYFNFVPFPTVGSMIAPLATPTLHGACITGVFSIDTGGIWICAPTSGVTFGVGTWKYSPAT